MVEEWKQWPGDSDIYVSSTGVIMSKKRGIWKRLKESKNNLRKSDRRTSRQHSVMPFRKTSYASRISF